MKHNLLASVLMYHALESPDRPCGLQDRGELVYVVDESRFRLHMALIEKSGAHVILPRDRVEGEISENENDYPSSSRRNDIILTFDDGHCSGYSLALSILSESSLRAVFFITTGWTGKDHYLTGEEIKKLHDSGMMIGSHGISHRFMTDLTDDELAAELTGSKKALESIIGEDVISFSAPGGRIDRRVTAAAVKAGYRWIFSSEPSGNVELTEGIPAGRFAVTGTSSDEWLSRIVSGNPPRCALVR